MWLAITIGAFAVRARRCRELGLLPGGQQSAREDGRRCLSAKSEWNVHICLRAALNDAIEDGLIRTNPARGVMKEPSGHQEMRPGLDITSVHASPRQFAQQPGRPVA